MTDCNHIVVGDGGRVARGGGGAGDKNQDLGGNPADCILLTHENIENIYTLTYKICVKIGYCGKQITV